MVLLLAAAMMREKAVSVWKDFPAISTDNFLCLIPLCHFEVSSTWSLGFLCR
jgi:hypothetical protein